MYNHTTLICKSFSVCNFWHTKPCLRTLVWLMRRTVRRLHCKKTCLYINVLTYKDVSVCKFSHRRKCLYVTWHLISHVVSRTPCVHTKVPPTRRIQAHFWLMKTRLCVTFNTQHRVFHLTFHKCPHNDVPPHDFLTYEPFSVFNFWHTKPCQRILIWLMRHTVRRVRYW